MFLRLLTFVSVAIATVTGSITNCDANSVFKPSRLALFPDPPVKGKTVDMIVEFENPGVEVTDGKVTTTMSLNYIPLPTDVKPLCEDTECPLTPGFNNRSTSSVWPDSVGGKVNSKIVWTGVDGETLLCLQMSTTVAADNITTEIPNNSAALIEYQAGNHSHLRPVVSSSSEGVPTRLRRNLRAN
jgi:hypothetical protein